MSTSDTSNLRLPSFFPRAPLECKQPAETFFDCFTAASAKKDDNDTASGMEGIKTCAKELSAYEKCMHKDATNKKTQSKLFRVQEEYRKSQTSNDTSVKS
jgi:hypothetical protein